MKRMWPKDKPTRLAQPSESEKLQKGPLKMPLSLRRVVGNDIMDFKVDLANATTTDEECPSTEEYSSEYEDGSDVEIPEDKVY